MSKWLTPAQAAELLPFGTAAWVRQRLAAGELRGSKINGRWLTDEAAIQELLQAGTNKPELPQRRRRRRSPSEVA